MHYNTNLKKLFYPVVLRLHTFLLINCICQVFLFHFTDILLKHFADVYIFGHGFLFSEVSYSLNSMHRELKFYLVVQGSVNFKEDSRGCKNRRLGN